MAQEDVPFHLGECISCKAAVWNEDYVYFYLDFVCRFGMFSSYYLACLKGLMANNVSQVNRVYRVTQELHNAPRGNTGVSMGPERMEVQARKFYSQRNMYLCGFTLFLSLILNRTYALILDVLRLEEVVSSLRKESNAGGDPAAEILKLKKELERKDMDLQAVKQQAEGLSREYGELSDRYSFCLF